MILYPSWRKILVVFIVLIAMLLGYFGWQFQRINKSFREHSLEHSTILSAVVEMNIRNAITSGQGMEAIIQDSLRNSARFIAYLNMVEPFSAQELEAFAQESGLSGIAIFDQHHTVMAEGPGKWLPDTASLEKPGLFLLPESHVYLYVLPFVQGPDFQEKHIGVAVAMPSGDVEKLRSQLSVERLLSLLNNMQGIDYVRLEAQAGGPRKTDRPATSLVQADNGPVAETRMDMAEHVLVVGLKADFFLRRISTLKKELGVFVSLLLLLGAGSSWWLYQVQRQRLEQTRRFERQMADQREQASLGRATATIAHEMRNPLNAISMGLQRLEMEVPDLDEERLSLVSGMGQAVMRINSVITRLLEYVQTFRPGKEALCVKDIIESLLALYRPQCEEKGVGLDIDLASSGQIRGDSHYLGQAFENLIKNAIEAQTGQGGTIKIKGADTAEFYVLSIENHCLTGDSDSAQKCLEPYYTTKSKGTGVGLPISKKIIESHHGILKVSCGDSRFCVTVGLPLDADNLSRT